MQIIKSIPAKKNIGQNHAIASNLQSQIEQRNILSNLSLTNGKIMLKIERLEWDASFFGFKVGRVTEVTQTNEEALTLTLKKAREEGYSLVYCFTKDQYKISSLTLNAFGGFLADQKVLFEGECKQLVNVSYQAKEYISSKVTDTLVKLAIESGQYSRFKLDLNFLPTDFERLYKTWIENSVNRKIADKVIVTPNENNIYGLATIKINQETGSIGLIAVDNTMQSKGYGKQLISAIREYLLSQGVPTVEVVTQLANIRACVFYKNCGFTEHSITNIYHFWL